jgi:hypothetical protein
MSLPPEIISPIAGLRAEKTVIGFMGTNPKPLRFSVLEKPKPGAKAKSEPMSKLLPIPILTLRDIPVLIDADLARLYGVPTRALNQAVRRNADRFPADFLFELSEDEKTEVITNCDHLKNLKFSKALPHAFTEHGALMAANVLNSPEAVKMSVFIIRAFIKQREILSTNQSILRRLAEIDKALLLHDSALRDLYQKLLPLLQPPPDPPRRRIGFKAIEDPAA